MALSIMIYHLIAWKIATPDAGSMLGVFGIYGVSIFFVLSGLSMAIVYHSYIKDRTTSFTFFLRRIFRIWPLLWICVLAVSAVGVIGGAEMDIRKILLNLTTLFGFVSPTDYINTGAWSIGNEMVYYAMTPLIIAIYNHKKSLGNMVVVCSILIGLYFAFFAFQPTDLASQWETYINPFNNLFFYTCGIALYYNFHEINFKKYSYFLILVPLLIYEFYPVSGNQINIVQGIDRVLFSLSAIVLTLGFYKLTLDMPGFISKPLANLGEATYGVYLLHPIVYMFINKIVNQPIYTILLTIIFTIIAANISYKFFEKPFVKLGKKTSENIEKTWGLQQELAGLKK